MAEKFPMLVDEKQAVITIDVGRWTTGGRERAVVVTSELSRITAFVCRDDGSWASWTRKHISLLSVPTSPEGVLRLEWSGNVGIVCDERTLVLVYKRRMEGNGRPRLWMDRLTWHQEEGFLYSLSEAPLKIPTVGIIGTGFSIFAERLSDRFAVITQAVSADQSPHLTCFYTQVGELAELKDDVSFWESTRLDQGGFDFDAKRIGDRIYVVHRRRAEMIRIPRDEMPQTNPYLLFDEPRFSDIPQLSSMIVPLVLVTIDTETLTAIEVDATLPAVEHPQIVHHDPMIIIGDRLEVGTFEIRRREDDEIVWYRPMRAHKLLMRRCDDLWLSSRLWFINLESFPRHQLAADRLQHLISKSNDRIGLSTLLRQHPTAGLGYTEDSKGQRLIVLHEDHTLGAVVATTLAMVRRDNPTGPHLRVTTEGFTVIDINHTQIGNWIEALPHPAENAMFNPLSSIGPYKHEDGFFVKGSRIIRNTLGGALIVAPERPASLFAYVDMGDGGCRVFFEEEVTLLPPVAPPALKELLPDHVPGPGGIEHAWISLEANELVSSALQPDKVPYTEFLRNLQKSDGSLDTLASVALMFIGAARLLVEYFEPASLQSGLQATLDLLPYASAYSGLLPLGLMPDAVAELRIDQGVAFELQRFISATSGTSQPARPSGRQPFSISFSYIPSFAFVNESMEFSATAAQEAGNVTFRWTFGENGPQASGANVRHVFDRPDGYLITLEATAENGDTATLTHWIVVSDSLWNIIWSPFDGVLESGSIELGGLELELFQYRLVYSVNEEGGRQDVRIFWRNTTDCLHRFVSGSTAGQGEVQQRIRIGFRTSTVRLEPPLGIVVQVNSVEGSYLYGRSYTPCILTSDRRNQDPVRKRPFAHQVETVQLEYDQRGATSARMAPSCLAMKPISPSTIELERVEPSLSFTPAARNISIVISVIVALGLGAIVFSILLALMIISGPISIVGAGLGALVAAAIALGLELLIIDQIAPRLMTMVAQGVVEDRLRAAIPNLRAQLEGQRILDYAGEGLAEALARQIINRAREMGYEVEEPDRKCRNRFRRSFFETVFVSKGLMKVLIRSRRR